MPSALFPAFPEEIGRGPELVGLLHAAPYAGAPRSSPAGSATSVARGLGTCVAAGAGGAAIAVLGLADALWLGLAQVAGAPAFVRFDAHRPHE